MRTRIITLLRRFGRRTDGVTAIEAAFIVPVFFAMVATTFEVSWVFFRTATIEAVATDAARMVMTGRAPQKGAITGTTCESGSDCFWDTICARVEVFGECEQNLSVEVRSFDTMSAAAKYSEAITCPNSAGYDRSEMEYDPGDRNAYAMVRICFTAKVFSPILYSVSMGEGDTGKRSIIAVQVRRNEPFLSNGQINPNEVL